MTVVYIASPVDQVGAYPEFAATRDEARTLLIEFGAAVYDPSKAWYVDSLDTVYDTHRSDYPQICHRLQESNIDVIRRSDLVFALSPRGIPSIGTPIDVYVALTQSKARVAVWAGEPPWTVVWNWMRTQFPGRVLEVPAIDRKNVRRALDWATVEDD